MSGQAVSDAPGPPSFDDVESALARDVRMYINSHAGDVKVVDITEAGDVTLGFSGACGRCPALSATFAIRVLPAVKAVPGVGRVTADNIHISEAALKRVARLFNNRRSNCA